MDNHDKLIELIIDTWRGREEMILNDDELRELRGLLQDVDYSVAKSGIPMTDFERIAYLCGKMLTDTGYLQNSVSHKERK